MKKNPKWASDKVALVFSEGKVEFAAKGAGSTLAAAVITVDVGQMTDNYAFARLAEALKQFTTQNQWPPVSTEG